MPPDSHSHSWSEITTGKPSTFAPIIGSGANQAVAGNDARLTNARTPLAHTHSTSDITSGILSRDRVYNDYNLPFASSGYVQIAQSGMKIAWGRVAPTGNSTARSLSFGVSFGYPPSIAFTNMNSTTTNAVTGAKATSISTTGATVYFTYSSGASTGFTNSGETHTWIAIGW